MPTVRLIVEEAAASLFKFSLDVFRAVPRDLKGGNFFCFLLAYFHLPFFAINFTFLDFFGTQKVSNLLDKVKFLYILLFIS